MNPPFAVSSHLEAIEKRAAGYSFGGPLQPIASASRDWKAVQLPKGSTGFLSVAGDSVMTLSSA
jgi:hypothetical protein